MFNQTFESYIPENRRHLIPFGHVWYCDDVTFTDKLSQTPMAIKHLESGGKLEDLEALSVIIDKFRTSIYVRQDRPESETRPGVVQQAVLACMHPAFETGVPDGGTIDDVVNFIASQHPHPSVKALTGALKTPRAKVVSQACERMGGPEGGLEAGLVKLYRAFFGGEEEALQAFFSSLA